MAQRRRGAALDEAILDAAWEELNDRGYAGFTVDAVVKRAQTSPPVLYRRYSDRPDLVRAAVAHAMRRSGRAELPDTGGLRADLLDLMQTINANGAQVATMMSLQLADHYAAPGAGLADLFVAARDEAADAATVLYERAVQRREIDAAVLTDRIKSLPFDLLRQEILITYAPVPLRTMEEIVDTIVLPLLAGARADASGGRGRSASRGTRGGPGR